MHSITILPMIIKMSYSHVTLMHTHHTVVPHTHITHENNLVNKLIKTSQYSNITKSLQRRWYKQA